MAFESFFTGQELENLEGFGFYSGPVYAYRCKPAALKTYESSGVVFVQGVKYKNMSNGELIRLDVYEGVLALRRQNVHSSVG